MGQSGRIQANHRQQKLLGQGSVVRAHRDEKISVNNGLRSTQTSLSENTLDSLVRVIFAGGEHPREQQPKASEAVLTRHNNNKEALLSSSSMGQ
ncbi:hypothetical protein CROQUDRAFT_97840 [Cronartium quercuum f. sp. fusiforme G11]|uniref:Uncharacterized protein n=1 Tax=Cronartium quercuum f. sp. fusiforme G11 TaxID=708437 RepID=A0A9P6NEC5_9BASI|nr:hypothetical protein CROQUDRAFT_97840 [Cronartium quercuum f. sp. fusiforme G11]